MDKLKSIGVVLLLVLVSYIVVSVLMPIIVTTSGSAAGAMETSPNAAEYGASVAGVNYSPLIIYFAPAIGGILAVYRILREKWL